MRMKEDEWHSVINTNLNSMYRVCKAALKSMTRARWGRIINISSINGQKGQFGQANYSAAKAGLIGLSKALAQEGAKKGITVNTVCPGYIDTEMVQAVPEKVLEGIIATIPVGRLGKAEEIASMCAYLASDESRFVTGAAIPIDGGVTAHQPSYADFQKLFADMGSGKL